MIRTIFIAAALALAVTLPAVQAQAQSIRTFVSVAGLDTNPCTITQPCRHFQAAVNATALGGEVDALDPGAYGSFTISQSISIAGQGWSYVAPPANGPAITINTPGALDKIDIRGVSLNGVDASGPTAGIVWVSGGTLNVRDCVIQNFTGDGMAIEPSIPISAQLFVSNTLISSNGINGIDIRPLGAQVTGFLDHVEVVNNHETAVGVEAGNTENINITITDSVVSNNYTGIVANSINGVGTVGVMVRNTSIINGVLGLLATGTGAVIRLTRSTITANQVPWTNAGGGDLQSYADNNIDGDKLGDPSPPRIDYK
jgi:hypothetical protein